MGVDPDKGQKRRAAPATADGSMNIWNDISALPEDRVKYLAVPAVVKAEVKAIRLMEKRRQQEMDEEEVRHDRARGERARG